MIFFNFFEFDFADGLFASRRRAYGGFGVSLTFRATRVKNFTTLK